MGNKRTGTKENQYLIGLDNSQVLQMLQSLADHLNVQIRYEKGDFRSSGCRVELQHIIFLQKTDPDDLKIRSLIRELGRFNLEGLEMHPELSHEFDLVRKAFETEQAVLLEEQ
jgi:hypothetical protein